MLSIFIAVSILIISKSVHANQEFSHLNATGKCQHFVQQCQEAKFDEMIQFLQISNSISKYEAPRSILYAMVLQDCPNQLMTTYLYFCQNYAEETLNGAIVTVEHIHTWFGQLKMSVDRLEKEEMKRTNTIDSSDNLKDTKIENNHVNINMYDNEQDFTCDSLVDDCKNRSIR